MNDLLVIILFSGGTILGLFATSLGYKTYRKFEYSVNFGLGLVLLLLPEIIYSETVMEPIFLSINFLKINIKRLKIKII